MNIALIYGTAAPAGRLSHAMSAFEAALKKGGAETSIIDLSRSTLPFAAGTPAGKLTAETRRIIDTVVDSNAVALFSPVYRAAPPGALKNMLDLLPFEALEGKPVAVVSMGATPHHYLANDVNLHPVLAWFGALAIPGHYLTGRSFEDGKLSKDALADLRAYAASLLDTAVRLDGVQLRPRPLAAAAKG